MNCVEVKVIGPISILNKDSKIYVAGHKGLVGSAIVRALVSHGYRNLVLRTRKELDLVNQNAVHQFFKKQKPDYVFLAAAKVGGILANNNYPADFIYENLSIQTNIIHAAYQYKVVKLLFLGSTCVYPKLAEQPIKEEALLTGPLEETNEWYAIAKIAGIKLCQAYTRQYGCNFITAMPTNLYGPGDNFDLQSSHVLPALIRKFHEAKKANRMSVEVWGSGTPRREFLYVEDCADACLHLMRYDSSDQITNIGTGYDQTISELAELIKKIVGYEGEIKFNMNQPDGTPQKLTDISKLENSNWRHKVGLEEGIKATYKWYQENIIYKKINGV